MSSASTLPGPGGFLQPTLPSPPPSSTNSVSNAPALLPQPRSTPLKPGSSKESSFVDYVDRKLLAVSRRYEKRFNTDFEDAGETDSKSKGYEDFGELAQDLEGVIDIIWVSGTRMETPYHSMIHADNLFCLPSKLADTLPPHYSPHGLYRPPIISFLTTIYLSPFQQARYGFLLVTSRHECRIWREVTRL